MVKTKPCYTKTKNENADNTSVAFRARELLSKISRVQFQINLS